MASPGTGRRQRTHIVSRLDFISRDLIQQEQRNEQPGQARQGKARQARESSEINPRRKPKQKQEEAGTLAGAPDTDPNRQAHSNSKNKTLEEKRRHFILGFSLLISESFVFLALRTQEEGGK
ncbi:hypothetical protein RB213_006119 [Colletotrichum asianum]